MVALVAVAALGAGVVLVPAFSTASRRPRPLPPHAGVVRRAVGASSSPAPAPSADGARAAALAAATASQRWLYLDDAHIAAEVAAIATPVAAPHLQRETLAEIGVARASLADSVGRVWWLVRPLAWRVDGATADRARVSVWTVTVLSASGVAVPQADWATVTVELAWQGGRWLVDAVADQPGPTPAVGPRDKPWDAAAVDQALAGFTRVDGSA